MDIGSVYDNSTIAGVGTYFNLYTWLVINFVLQVHSVRVVAPTAPTAAFDR